MEKLCGCQNCRDRLCIHRVPIFSSLDQEDMVKISGLILHKDYRKGEQILTDGNESEAMIIMNEGSAKAYKDTPDGREQILYVFTEGDFFGEQNLLADKKAAYSVEALTPVKTCRLLRTQFNRLLYQYPEIAVKIIGELGGRLSRMENALQGMGIRNVDARIAGILIEYASKYGSDTGDGTVIRLPLSREGIANYLGIARETLSRKFGQLENDGIIRSISNKAILICDREALKKAAGTTGL